MKFKIVLWTIVFLAIISGVSADLLSDGLGYYTLDGDDISGTTIINSNGTNVTNAVMDVNQTGKINEGLAGTSVNNKNINLDPILDNSHFNTANSLTISLWFNSTSQAANQMLFSSNGGGNSFRWYIDTNGYVNVIGWISSSCGSLTDNVDVVDGDFHHLVVRIAGTNVTLFRDAVEIGSYISSCSGDRASGAFLIGSNNNAEWYVNGVVDEVYLLTRAITNSEVTDLKTNGDSSTQYPFAAAPPSGDSINLSQPTPINNTQYKVGSIDFNVSVNSTQNFDIRLYVNDVLNFSTSGGIGDDTNISVNTNFSSTGTYTYYFEANTSDTTENSSRNTLHIDLENPSITIVTWTDNKTFYNLGENITGKWNFTDDFLLHNYTISIDGVNIDSKTDLNVTVYDYNLTYSPSSLSSGQHNISIKLSDGHTAKELGGDYYWTNGIFNDYLQYEFWDEGFARIEAKDGSIFDTFSTKREKDKYTFSYEPYDDKKTSYQFEVTSDLPIHIVNSQYSQWKTWLIMGNHWLDFYNPTEQNQKVTFKQISDNIVEITIKDITKKDKLSFESIGDLNIITKNYSVIITDIEVTYSSSVNELETQTISLEIDTTGTTIISTDATLEWNGSSVNVTKTINSDNDLFSSSFLTPTIIGASQNINFTWNYTIITSVNNLTGDINNTQSIVRIGIDNCSNYNTTAINWSIIDEDNDAALTGTIDGYFRGWIDSISSYRDFNLTWAGSSIYGLCIFPSNATYNISTQIEYSAPGYDTKNYYLTNTQINNISENINLYLSNTTTTVTMNVVDENDNELSDVYIHIQSYDIGTNSYTTTEIVKTDSDGNSFAEIIANTQWYRFVLYYNEEIVLSTEPTKVTGTTLNFRVNLAADALANFNQVFDISCSLSYNNDTRNFRFDFNNPSGNSIIAIMRVYNESISQRQLMNTSTTTSASGWMLYNIGSQATLESANLTYIASASIILEGEEFNCGTPASIKYGGAWKTFGTEGLFMSFLFVVLLVMIGIWSPVAAVLFAMVGVLFATFLGIFHLGVGAAAAIVIIGGVVIYKSSSR